MPQAQQTEPAPPEATIEPPPPPTGEREEEEEAGASGGEDSDDENPVPIQKTTSAELSEHDRQMESQLRAYLLEHRRKQEGVDRRKQEGGARANPAEPQPLSEKPSGAEEGKGDSGGFDIFNDDVEEAGAVEEAVDEAAMMDRGDNYDDKEGYYAHRVGDILNDRYKAHTHPAHPLPPNPLISPSMPPSDPLIPSSRRSNGPPN